LKYSLVKNKKNTNMEFASYLYLFSILFLFTLIKPGSCHANMDGINGKLNLKIVIYFHIIQRILVTYICSKLNSRIFL